VKIAVLTDAESATGFRLAGLEVHVADSPEAAEEILKTLARREDLAMLAVDQGLVADPQALLSREMRGRALPVVLPFPSLGFAFAEEGADAKAYIRRLVKSTIGYEIKL